jgi:signal transduction histidine kinase
MEVETDAAVLSTAIDTLERLLQGPEWGESVFFLTNGSSECPQFLDRLFALADNQSKTVLHVDFAAGQITRHTNVGLEPLADLKDCKQLESAAQLLGGLLANASGDCFCFFDGIGQLMPLRAATTQFKDFLAGLCQQLHDQGHSAYFRLSGEFITNPELRSIVEALPGAINTWTANSRLYLQPIRLAGCHSPAASPLNLEGKGPSPFPRMDGDGIQRLLEKNIREFQELYAEKRELERALQKKSFELSLVNELTATLLSTTKLDQMFHRILVGVTANEGLGFNRAFLLLVNSKSRMLEGKMAIGPSSLEEALRIWGELSRGQFTFADIVTAGDEDWPRHDVHVNQVVKGIRVRLEDRAHLLMQLLYRTKPEIVGWELATCPHAEDLFRLFEVQSFAAVPLLYRNLPLGLLLADNAITQKPIAPENLPMLETFANYAAAAIEHSRLYEEIRLRMTENERHLRELEAMQDRLVRSKRLSELGELASKMAHEVRTPLVSIGGFANAMLKTRAAGSTDHEYLKIIVEEVRRLEGIISNVLTYVSPGIPRVRMASVEPILDQAVFLMKASLERAHIVVHTNYADQLPAVPVDPDQMKQVFLALIDNALESMSAGGELAISATLRGDFLRISFSDTGVGIEKDKLKKVFEAFFTTKSRGSGLGLSIASQIISNHKGSIYVESEMGCGATFHINLPSAVH